MVLDISVARQRYVEDCEVCCNPIEICYQALDEMIVAFEARQLE
jgi:hypothetical protein